MAASHIQSIHQCVQNTYLQLSQKITENKVMKLSVNGLLFCLFKPQLCWRYLKALIRILKDGV